MSERAQVPLTGRRKHRRRALTSLVALVVLVASVLVGLPSRTPEAQAFYAPGGQTSSQYVTMIDWVDWTSLPNMTSINLSAEGRASYVSRNNVNRVNPTVRSITDLGGGNQIVVTCALSNANNAVSFHAPGAYVSDAFDNYYDAWTGSRPTSGKLVGIGSNGPELAYDLNCSAQAVRNGVETNLPITGLVFANAEAVDKGYNYRTRDYGEFFNIAPQKTDPNTSVTWRVLDNPVSQCGSSMYFMRGTLSTSGNSAAASNLANVEMSNALQMFSPDLNCEDQGRLDGIASGSRSDGPFASVFAEGASGARIQTYTNGGNYLAVGVVVNADASDGATTYGAAGAIIQPSFIGGEIPASGQTFSSATRHTTSFSDSNKAQNMAATVLDPLTTPRLGAEGVDGDLKQVGEGGFTTFVADDVADQSQIDDETTLGNPVIPAVAGQSYRLQAQCNTGGATAQAVAWLDWNANGRFDDNEKSTSACNSTATFTWDVDASELPTVNATNRGVWKSAVRLVVTSDTETLAGTNATNSLYLDGEVEDYPVTLVHPNVTATKQIAGAGGEIVNAAAAGWDLTLADSNGTQAQTQTTVDGGGVFWDVTFAAGDVIDIANPQIASRTLYLTETQKTGYEILTQQGANATCAPRGQPGDWGSVFAWPNLRTSTANIASDSAPGVSLTLDATSVLDCTITNQPVGQISVTPTIDASGVAGIDPELRFAGNYTCAAGTGSEVSGTWGPVAAGVTWTSNVATDKIPLGASCVITQTAISSAAQPNAESAAPVIGDYRYDFDEPVYSPSGQGGATVVANTPTAGAGNAIPQASIVNPIVEVPTLDVTFTKVDTSQNLVAGAEFSLSGGPGISLDIVDADGETAGNADGDAAGGEFQIAGLPAGEYTLTETAAPLGFVELDQPITFEITESDLAAGTKNLGAIVNERAFSSPVPGIPMSGGTGTIVYTVGGAIALMCALGLGLARRRKEQAL